MSNFAYQIFDNIKILHGQSEYIAKQLYKLSVNPWIKSCDLFVAYISKLTIADEVVDAIGIFLRFCSPQEDRALKNAPVEYFSKGPACCDWNK